MRMDAAHKMGGVGADGQRRIEKAVLREAFEGALPREILWRQKEQFSDGVGYGWIDGLKAHAEAHVSDADFAAAGQRFPVNPPQTKEAYLPAHFRGAVPGRGLREDRAGRQVDRVLVAGGDRLGCRVRGDGRSSGRAVAGVHDEHAVAAI